MMDTTFGMLTNRFITWIKPGLNVIAGGIAAWLVAKANILGIPNLDEANVQTYVAAGLAGLLTTGLTQLGDLKWIKGHHIELEARLFPSPDDVNERGSDLIPPDEGDIGQMGPEDNIQPTQPHPHG
jgi:hypothetical protein